MNVYILPQILKGKMSFEECKLFPCYVYLFNNLWGVLLSELLPLEWYPFTLNYYF